MAVDDGFSDSDSLSDRSSAADIDKDTIVRIVNSVSSEAFNKWHQEKEFAENIRDGTPYFNGSTDAKPPKRHSPSSLLQCHRKIFYKQLNAPAESPDPKGIFWIGSRFEEDVALPFLREVVAGSDEYVTNSLWVDCTVQTSAGDIHFKGQTDPVIVDANSRPRLLTEIKTKKSVENLKEPSSHHRAQAHAYMYGLSEKYDQNITDTIILYGGRTNLNIQPFYVTFDPLFWRQTVLKWAAKHTTYRLDNELPPADPEHGWECTFCSYRERCGTGNSDYSDIGSSGLLPGVAKYPKSKVVEYLEAHDEARLTPTLAKQYPTVASQYQVAEWRCTACRSTFEWDHPDWDGNPSHPPLCPECVADGTPVPLQPPSPNEQQTQREGDADD